MRGSRDGPLAWYFVNHPQKINQIYLQFKQFTSNRHKQNIIFKILFLHTSTFCVGVFRFQVVRPSACLRFLFFANWVEAAFFAWQDWATWRAPFETTWVLSHLRRPLCFWKQIGQVTFLLPQRIEHLSWVQWGPRSDQQLPTRVDGQASFVVLSF